MAAFAVQTERRQSTRHPFDGVVNVCPSVGGAGPRWRGHIRNLSRHGLKLWVERRFEKNTFLTIRMEDAEGDEMFSLFGQVVYVNAEPDGHWSVGCRFTKEMNERDLEELVNT